MEVKIHQLTAHLKKSLLPVYLLSGDTPLLIQEATDTIRQAASAAGFTARERLEVESGFNWGDFNALAQNFSLFGDKTLIELRNPSAKFSKESLEYLNDYLSQPPQDKVLLILTDKLSGAQKKANWYKAIDKVGATITVWPVSPRDLPGWISARLQQARLKADPNSIRLLAELTEGNLLSTQQAIEKLRLLYPEELITPEKMADAVNDSARFNVFDLGNYALSGQTDRVQRIVQGLRFTGVEPTLALWALAREIRTLFSMNHALQQGTPMAQVLASEWQSRKALLQSALTRLRGKDLSPLLKRAEHIDHLIKGIKPGEPWEALERLAIALAQHCAAHVRKQHA